MSIPSTTPCILDGKALSRRFADELAAEIADVRARHEQNQTILLPKLTVVLVGEDPASQVYVGKKAQMAQKLGMLSEVITLPADTTQADLLSLIARLNADISVHGMLIQLPLPRHIDTQAIMRAVSPEKDVDGLHPLNLGLLMAGDPEVCKPCTPAGIIELLKNNGVALAGKHAVVLGRSNIVGKPIGMLLLQENATVTYCHSKTPDLPSFTRQADIVVAAVGVPGLVTADWIRPGAAVVDVGINRVDGRLVGDVDFESVAPKAAWITPVPGGVGPMTIAMLMRNAWTLYQKRVSG